MKYLQGFKSFINGEKNYTIGQKSEMCATYYKRNLRKNLTLQGHMCTSCIKIAQFIRKYFNTTTSKEYIGAKMIRHEHKLFENNMIDDVSR